MLLQKKKNIGVLNKSMTSLLQKVLCHLVELYRVSHHQYQNKIPAMTVGEFNDNDKLFGTTEG